MAESPDDAVTLEQRIALEQEAKRLISALRNSKYPSKSFKTLLEHSDEYLAQAFMRGLTPAGLYLATKSAAELTLENFAALPQAATMDDHASRQRGVYVLFAADRNGDQWALYVGSSGDLAWR
jgi:hypothetical protein